MTTPGPDLHQHPVLGFAHALDARLDEVVGAPVWSLGPSEVREALVVLTRAVGRLEGLRLSVLAEADRSGATEDRGAATAADWVATQTRQARRAARADLGLAAGLETHRVLAAGVADGRVSPAQARVVLTALDRLPVSGRFALTSDQRLAAEEHLVAQAAFFDPVELARLGERLFEVIAPELADEFAGRALTEQEARAARRTRFTMWHDDQGTSHGRFRIPALHGQMLHKMLLALTSPARHLDTTTPPGMATPEAPVAPASGEGPLGKEGEVGERVPAEVRRGTAFCQLLLEAIPAQALPTAGGCSATIVVTMTLDQLTSRVTEAGVCEVDTGTRLSAAASRRLACTAGIIPVVLGGPSQVLDVGRRRRLHTEPQRLALAVRDRGCTAEGCDKPPAMCQAHHDQPWAAGGRTNVADGRLLCWHHHQRIHDPRYSTTHQPTGKVAFHLRC